MSTDPHVLLVEDEDNVASVVALALRHSGFEVGQRMRAGQNDLPVLFLTARHVPADRIQGLTIGRDDYLTKPFGVDELVARMKVILRRVGRGPPTRLIQFGDLSLDDDAHTVTCGDGELVLSPTKYGMLRCFMRNPGLVVSKARILDRVWHDDFVGNSTVAETHLSTLRKTFGTDGRDLIQIVHIYGHRFSGNEAGAMTFRLRFGVAGAETAQRGAAMRSRPGAASGALEPSKQRQGYPSTSTSRRTVQQHLHRCPVAWRALLVRHPDGQEGAIAASLQLLGGTHAQPRLALLMGGRARITDASR